MPTAVKGPSEAASPPHMARRRNSCNDTYSAQKARLIDARWEAAREEVASAPPREIQLERRC